MRSIVDKGNLLEVVVGVEGIVGEENCVWRERESGQGVAVADVTIPKTTVTCPGKGRPAHVTIS